MLNKGDGQKLGFKISILILIVGLSFYAGVRRGIEIQESALRTQVVDLGHINDTRGGRLAIYSEFTAALRRYPRYDRVSVKWRFSSVGEIELGCDRVHSAIFLNSGNTVGCGVSENDIYEIEKGIKKKDYLGFEYPGWWSADCGVF